MRVLVACEYSGRVRDAFLRRGHDAVSCDLLPTDVPGPHIQGDVLDVLDKGWDLMIAHPPCTYLTCAAEWAYGPGPYHQKVKPGTLTGAARLQARAQALSFARCLWDADIPRIVLENPVGILAQHFGKAQTIQPHQYGEDASKRTCLWHKGTPHLVPTKHVPPRMVNGKPRWANQTDGGQNRLSPSADRWKDRSTTYYGIAEALAEQLG